MAVYKVPQDVEADDKLIGPFSFRQFIYLLIVAGSIALAWALGRLFIPLAIIPLPFILFFGTLALPLRKDQPMEIYMAAMVSFFLKPHRRLWDPDGIESLIEITVPKIVEYQRTKNISQSEAEQRFGYLAQIIDSQGWAVRGMAAQEPDTAMNSDVYFAAQQTEDILDSQNMVAQNLDYRLDQSNAKHRQDMVDRMKQQIATPTSPITPTPQATATATSIPTINPYNFFTNTQPITPTPPVLAQPTNPTTDVTQVTYDPYPTDIQQSVIQPLDQSHRLVIEDNQPPATTFTPEPIDQPSTSKKPLSPDIINLASNADLSIETIAREANRIHDKEDMSEEVVISLR